MDDDRIMTLFGQIMDKLERMDGRFVAIDHRFEAIDRRFDRVDSQLEGLREDMQVTMAATQETDRRRRADRQEIDGTNELLGRAMMQILQLRADVDELKRRAA